MVEKLNKEYAINVEWRPFYLRPDTPPDGMELPDYVKKAQASGADQRLKSLADLHGLKFSPANRLYNTRLAHEATAYAIEHGQGNPFHHAVFQKIYGDGLDISKWEVLREAAQEVGLDADEMQKLVTGGKYTAEVSDQVQQASQIGVSSVPTYVINDRYAIIGAQPYEAFKNALEKILK